MRRFALAFLLGSSWSIGAVRGQEVAPYRELAPPQLVVHVVEAEGGAPVAGAQLWCMTVAERTAELERRWGVFSKGFDPVEYDEVIRSFGRGATSGADGHATLPRPEGVLRLVASLGETFGALEVAAGEAGPVTIAVAKQRAIDVHVVDAAGKGVAGVPVAVGWRFAGVEGAAAEVMANLPAMMRQDSMATAWPARFLAVATTEPDGRARFARTSDWTLDDGMGHFALLGFPVVDGVELRLTNSNVAERHELVLPPTGRVVIRFAGVSRGVAQVRRLGDAGHRPYWPDFDPARAAIVDGVATWPLVGVGTPLQYRASWPGLAAPVEGTLDGPGRAGETVEFEAQGETSMPRLVGRLVDEEGSAIASRDVEFHIELSWSNEHGSNLSGNGHALVTGPDGSFSFNLDGAVPPGGRRLLTISEPWWHEPKVLGSMGAKFDLTAPLKPGRRDLGDVVLYRSGSLDHVRRLDDDALERLYAAARAGCGFSGDPQHDADACLTVMAERGGARWVGFLQRAYDAAKQPKRATLRFLSLEEIEALDDAGSEEDEEEEGFDDGGEEALVPDDPGLASTLLMALRRAQGRRCPIALAVVTERSGAPEIASCFPDGVVLRYELTNVDELGEALFVESRWHEGPFGDPAVAITLQASDGTRPSSAARFGYGQMGVRSGSQPVQRLAPGASLRSAALLRWIDHLPFAGDYRLELAFHPAFPRDFSDARAPWSGWLAAIAPPVTWRVAPREIALPGAERFRLRDCFAAIDHAQPRVIAPDSWRPGQSYVGEPTSPEDELFRAGWSAVPVLLDVLDEPSATADQKAWALALLASITPFGLDLRGNPRFFLDEPAHALGLHRAWWSEQWPSIARDDRRDPSWQPDLQGPATPDLAVQARLIARWRDVRTGLSIRD